jgi:hypothetical protein
MTARGDRGLDCAARAALERALAADPALDEELELIVAHFSSEARGRFWRAFAAECERADRPATAVLGALARASSDRR